MDYYKKMYDIEIKNVNQPMLITKAKKRDIGNTTAPKVCSKIYKIYNEIKIIILSNTIYFLQDSDICCLVPELCNLTGLTEAMKSDFKLMKALQTHTLVTPELRQNAIIDFINRINGMTKLLYFFYSNSIINMY